MGKKQLRFPSTQRTAEQGQSYAQNTYKGMLYNSCPPQRIPDTHCFRNRNVIDRGDWYEVRPGLQEVGALDMDQVFCWHEKWERLITYRNASSQIHVKPEDLNSQTLVWLFGGGNIWAGFGTGIQFNNTAVLLNGDIWRVEKDGSNGYYAYMLNVAVPATIITDLVMGVKQYRYRYMQSYCRIEGGEMNDSRIDTDNGAVLKLETGTGKEGRREYTEVWYNLEAGDAGLTSYLYYLEVAQSTQLTHITHHGLYRTRLLTSPAGETDADPRYFTYVEDVPVCKAVSGTIVANTFTKGADSQEFVAGDKYSYLFDDAGNSGQIVTVTSTSVVQLAGGHTLGAGAVHCAIGRGRVMEITQVGTRVTDTGAGSFVAADAGANRQELFYHDGSRARIVRYIDANNVDVSESKAIAATRAATLGAVGGTYRWRRAWYDTLPDDGEQDVQGINERQLFERDLYIPLFGYQPIPSVNVGFISSGFLVCGMAVSEIGPPAGNNWYYSAIGAKEYSMGQYSPFYQYETLDKEITEILVAERVGILVTTDSLRLINLTVTSDAGNPDVGESIPKLFPSSSIDENVGVPGIARATITKVAQNLWLAMTNEPGLRELSPTGWGRPNYLVDQTTGFDAVYDYFRARYSTLPICAWYSQVGGYKICFQMRVWDNDNGAYETIYMVLRFAYLPQQGIGWTEIDGDKKPYCQYPDERITFTHDGIERCYVNCISLNPTDPEGTFEESTWHLPDSGPVWTDKQVQTGSYIDDPFTTGVDTWWSAAFNANYTRTLIDGDWTMKGIALTEITPAGTTIRGDFDLIGYIKHDAAQGANRSFHLEVWDVATASEQVDVEWNNGNFENYHLGVLQDQVAHAWIANELIGVRIRRTGNTITSYYNVGGVWTAMATTFTLSADEDVYVKVDGASEGGWSEFDWTSDYGLPYTFPPTAGDEIWWQKWYRELGDENRKEHLLTKFLTRPQVPSNKGDSRYDANGYRAAQQIDLDVYVDGILTRPFASVTDIPENGDVHFGGTKVEGRQFMFVLKGAASEIIVTDTSHLMLNKPKQGSRAERTMDSNEHQLLLSVKSYSISRDERILFERVSQTTIPGNATLVTGPDGRARSGMLLAAITPLLNPAVAGTYSVVYWRRDADPATIPALAPMTQYGDAYGGWSMWYATGANLVANSLVINPGGAFDINIYPADVTVTLEAVYNDVCYHAGRAYLPWF